jgi:CBS domain containing-hemolysin-like protein
VATRRRPRAGGRDRGRARPGARPNVRTGDGFVLPGHLTLRRLERLLQLSLTQPDDVDSIGGLLAARLGDRLAPGATLEWEGLVLRAEQLRDGRAVRVAVTVKPSTEP